MPTYKYICLSNQQNNYSPIFLYHGEMMSASITSEINRDAEKAVGSKIERDEQK